MRKILIGNWKMNPKSAAEALRIASEIKRHASKARAEIVVCPPLSFLHLIQGKIKKGAQDVSIEDTSGAFTGEVSAEIIKSIGASYAIIGHSERRARGDTSHTAAKKAINALQAGISPIICVGEKERHADASHWQAISHELRESLHGIPKALAKKCVIAYEPIWAVGRGKRAMKPVEVSESAIFIKKVLADIFSRKIAASIRVVYGGSVDWKNAGEIASAHGLSGLLVGRDSLAPSHFAKIAEALK